MRTITQEIWAETLVAGWYKDQSLGWVVATAAGVQPEEKADWPAIIALAGNVTPPVQEFTSMRQPVRPWIAAHAHYANDALWDGRFEKAKQLFIKGGARKTYGRQTVKGIKKEDRTASRGKYTFTVRERDKRTDWGTVK